MKKISIILIFILAISLLLTGQQQEENQKRVLIGGRVFDGTGKGVQGFPVVLLVEREVIDISSFRSEVVRSKKFTTETDARGKFYFTWTQDDFFNKFYLDFMPAGLFDKVQFNPVVEPRHDVSLKVGKGKNVDVNITVVKRVDWPKLVKLIEVYGKDSDKGKVLRKYGFFERETVEELGAERYTFWWYYTAGRAFKFQADRVVKEFIFTPLKPMPIE